MVGFFGKYPPTKVIAKGFRWRQNDTHGSGRVNGIPGNMHLMTTRATLPGAEASQPEASQPTEKYTQRNTEKCREI